MKRPDLLAHSAPRPDALPQLYEDHIANVRSGARERAEAMLCFATPSLGNLVDAIESAAVFHDLGKLDPENQKALAQGRDGKLEYDHIDAGVAHLSAVGNWLAAWLVRAHHAPGFPECLRHFDKDRLGRKLRGRRHDDIADKEHDEQIKQTDTNLSAYLAAHESAVGPHSLSPIRAVHGLTMRLALSCLVDSDHSDTARFKHGIELPNPPQPRWKDRLRRLDEYISKLPSSGNAERNGHRRQFYEACCGSKISESLIACEGPVGIGKTTAVIAYLLKQAISERLRRIIVVAPYTNIITQTARTLRKALVLDGEDAQQVVIEHHHRADFSNITTRDLAVLWRAPIIVTTAVQFFETLASNRSGDLRKLHALPGSAVFVDEAHAALPAHLWRQNWAWLRELADQWSCRFVFASGSLARFWENPDIVARPQRIPELLPSELKQRLMAAERRRIEYKQAGHFENVSDLINVIRDTKGPRLVIFNTVQSAAFVAREMCAAGDDVSHLSTALAPRDRDLILAHLTERLKTRDDRNWTLVATSCVEAGVDLSFGVAFRERFSAASIVQVGGRINRHGESDDGTVFDFTIDAGARVTRHPAARYSAGVLKRQFAAGLFKQDDHDPAEIVTAAMAEEIRDRGGLGHDLLVEEETFRNYPKVRELAQVISADTRLVVIDSDLAERLERRERVGFRELLSTSVQIWAHRIEELGLTPVRGRTDVWRWPYAYDANFLGYMAGVLAQTDLSRKGFAII